MGAKDTAACLSGDRTPQAPASWVVTSFGYSPNCTGVGGAYRIDQPDDLAFLAGFDITP